MRLVDYAGRFLSENKVDTIWDNIAVRHLVASLAQGIKDCDPAEREGCEHLAAVKRGLAESREENKLLAHQRNVAEYHNKAWVKKEESLVEQFGRDINAQEAMRRNVFDDWLYFCAMLLSMQEIEKCPAVKNLVVEQALKIKLLGNN